MSNEDHSYESLVREWNAIAVKSYKASFAMMKPDDMFDFADSIPPGAFRRVLRPPAWRDYSNCRGEAS